MTTTEAPSKNPLWHLANRAMRHKQITNHKAAAAERKIQWTLTDEEYARTLGDGICHYCHEKILTGGVGLDRKDNARGYEADNVVPCCYSCNFEKGSLISFEEYEWLWRFRTSRAEAEGEVARRRVQDGRVGNMGKLCGRGIDWRASLSERADKRECGLSVDAPWPELPTTTVFEWRTTLGITQDQAVRLLVRLGESGWSFRTVQRNEHQPYVLGTRRKEIAIAASNERAQREAERRGTPRALICSVCGEAGHNKRRHAGT